MRFRLGRLEDLPGCHRMLRADGGLRASDDVWNGLIRVWQEMFEGVGGRGTFVVYERDDDESELELCGFSMSAFVREAFVREERSRPEPHLAARFYERLQRGERLFLEVDEIREANTNGTLHLLILHSCHRNPFDHPETRRLLPVASQSFLFSHAGYRFESITGEYHGTEAAEFLRHGGWMELSDYPDHEEARRAPKRPFLFGLDREHCQPGAANLIALQIFHPESPLLYFTLAEQRLLLHALTGLSDRQLAVDLDVSVETVRSTWDSIYTRVGRTRPRLLQGENAEASPAARGAEKRRYLLDYLRQHMEELRPINRPAETRTRS